MDTDEYLHALGAYEVYWAVVRGGWAAFWEAFFAQSYYPPLGKLPIVISYLLGGATLFTARAPGLFLLAITFWVTFKAAARLEPSVWSYSDSQKSDLSRSLRIFVGVGAGFGVGSCVICMLEPMGMVVTAAVAYVLAGIRGLEDLGARRNICAIGLCIVALFLTKYTLPVTVVPGLVLGAFSCCNNWQEAKRTLINLLKIGIVSLLGMFAWYLLADRAAMSEYIFEYPARGWAIGINFLVQYPRQLITDMFLNPLLGVFVMCFAIYGGVSSRNILPRVAIFALLTTTLLNSLLAERGLRFLVTLLPFICILFAIGFSRALPVLGQRFSTNFALASFVLGSWIFGLDNFKAQLLETMEYTPGHYNLAEPYERLLIKEDRKVFVLNFTDKPVFYYNWLAMTKNMISPASFANQFQEPSNAVISSVSKAKNTADLKNIMYSLNRDVIFVFDRSSPGSRGLNAKLLKDLCDEKSCEEYSDSTGSLMRFSSLVNETSKGT